MSHLKDCKNLVPLLYAWFLLACADIQVLSGSAAPAPTLAAAAVAIPAGLAAPGVALSIPAAAPLPEPFALAEAASKTQIPEPRVLETVLPGPRPGTAAVSSAGDGAKPVASAGSMAPAAEFDRIRALTVEQHQPSVDGLCEQIGNKLSSVSAEDCLKHQFRFGGGFSVNQRPLVIKEYQPLAAPARSFRVLIMGGIHGDEYSSISILFKWLALFSPQELEGEFHWRFAPLVNPDGLFAEGQAARQNANGVDLNRNFPSQDWSATAARHWKESTGSNPRRFPGSSAGSEPEVQWVVAQIEDFQPDVIVSVHAPYHLLDFDGPARAPEKIGELYLHQLGVYPGSLGNFAGLNRRIPVVTLELPSAGIMPPPEQINLMWHDLVAWLDREGREGRKDLAN